MNTLQLHGFDVIRCSPSAQLHSGTNTIDIIMIYFKDMKPLKKKRGHHHRGRVRLLCVINRGLAKMLPPLPSSIPTSMQLILISCGFKDMEPLDKRDTHRQLHIIRCLSSPHLQRRAN